MLNVRQKKEVIIKTLTSGFEKAGHNVIQLRTVKLHYSQFGTYLDKILLICYNLHFKSIITYFVFCFNNRSSLHNPNKGF